jgi:hypothetical protein
VALALAFGLCLSSRTSFVHLLAVGRNPSSASTVAIPRATASFVA